MFSNKSKEFATLAQNVNDLKIITRKYASVIEQIKEETNFLPNKSKLRQRLWYIQNNTIEHPRCKTCGNPILIWHNENMPEYCSTKCQCCAVDVKNKRLQTRHQQCISSAKNLLKNKEFLEEQFFILKKTSKQIAEELNVSYYDILRQFKKHFKITSINQLIEYAKQVRDIRILVSYKNQQDRIIIEQINQQTSFLPNKSEIRERLWYIENNTQRPPKCKICDNNVKWNHTNQEFYTYCSAKCQGKDSDIITKREQTNLQKTGRRYWNQQHITIDAISKLQDKDWMHNQHFVLKKPLTTIAEELNVHPLLPAQYLDRYDINGHFWYNSQPTQDIANYISSTINLDIITNNRQIIAPYEIDIFIPVKKIAIEFNGIYWHSENNGIDRDYHLKKTLLCEKNNIRLIHIFESAWRYKKEIVISRLNTILNAKCIRKINGRDCFIRELNNSTTSNFINANHIQGHINSKINIGLFYNEELVAIMTFGKPRFDKKYQYELLRYCSSINTIIHGGASKLFNYFINEYNPQNIITYSDKSWNTGKLYRILGFEFSHTSGPNYWYFKNNSYTLHSRVKFQKHKLSKILKIFDPSLTEWENMKNNGYNRIWDCGNDVWAWQK
jgi:endogenous inhibitor of DNA gyrase (YacG/DUF329 family)